MAYYGDEPIYRTTKGSPHAPKGLAVGTRVVTNGGDYRIVDAGTEGATYNPNSGYYSVPWSNDFANIGAATSQQVPQAAPQDNSPKFSYDSNIAYENYLAAKNALIDKTYQDALNTLNKGYDENMMNYDLQKGQIRYGYEDAERDIHGQTYRSIEQANANASNRGLMNSAMGAAQEHGMIREGNRNINIAARDRDRALNDLSTRINNLTKAYHGDLSTLEKNKASDQLAALHESLYLKDERDYDIYKTERGYEHDIDMQSRGFKHDEGMQQKLFEHNMDMEEFRQKWQSMENNLDRIQQWNIAQLNVDAQIKCATLSAGAQRYAADLAYQSASEAQAWIEKTYEEEKPLRDAERKARLGEIEDENRAKKFDKLYGDNIYNNPNTTTTVPSLIWKQIGDFFGFTTAQEKEMRIKAKDLLSKGFTKEQAKQHLLDNNVSLGVKAKNALEGSTGQTTYLDAYLDELLGISGNVAW